MNANESANNVTGSDEHHGEREEIALRAYRLWQERGSPLGSPEEDWLRAEQEVCRQGGELTQTCDNSATPAQVAPS